jgi:hypothetical protein
VPQFQSSAVPLTTGAYEARSIIASAQRCLNLYPEKNPDDSPFPYTQYLTPGLTLLGTAPANPGLATAGWRMLYAASTGDLYGVCGNGFFYIAPNWAMTFLGSVSTGATRCSMTDNNVSGGILADGTTYSSTNPGGWEINLTARTMTPLSPANNSSSTGGFGWVGATRMETLDTYILGNAPTTQQFWSTDPATIAFDPFWFAAKTGYNDNLASLAIVRREIWLIGTDTSEIWFDAGGSPIIGETFPFQIMPGPFNQHGTCAPDSVADSGGAVFFLSQNKTGERIVAMGEGYQLNRISTHALEEEMQGYSVVSDANGFCYQSGGHVFYWLNFPTADKTWVYDTSTKLWHERCWLDTNGIEHRHRANVCAHAYNTLIVGDWQNGNLYRLDRAAYTDNGHPIKRLRSWPHLVKNGTRQRYRQFIADMDVGTAPATTAMSAPRRVFTDTTLACLGIPADPLTIGALDGVIGGTVEPAMTAANPQAVTSDGTTITGDGTASSPLSVILADGSIPPVGGASGSLPWVITDDTIGGDGSPAAPLFVDLVDGLRGVPACVNAMVNPPLVRLRWSDSKGRAWGRSITQSLGASGQALTQVQWQRLGYARDRVFEVSWSAPTSTALNGAWVGVSESRS